MLTQKEIALGIDPDDRTNIGYLEYYGEMLAILEALHEDEDAYREYQEMTKKWIEEARSVLLT